MNSIFESRWLPIVLLTCSNIFMTFAWYGHLKFKDKPLALVIAVSWGIAFFEYCFHVSFLLLRRMDPGCSPGFQY